MGLELRLGSDEDKPYPLKQRVAISTIPDPWESGRVDMLTRPVAMCKLLSQRERRVNLTHMNLVHGSVA